MDIKQMEELGVADYYLRLTDYSNDFINRNYPLKQEDMKAIISGNTTNNLDTRNAIYNIMKSEIEKIIETQIDKNNKFIQALQNGEQVIPKGIEEYNQDCLNYQQQILEKVWEYRTASTGLKTQIMLQNENLISDALNNGISSDAVEETLKDVISVAEKSEKIPSQVKNVVNAIVEMKPHCENIKDNSFSSDFFRKNNQKIQSAIKDGIEPQEIVVALTRSTQNANTHRDKRTLKFSVNLISTMKKKEIKLRKEKDEQNTQEKSRQYVYR